MVTLNSRMDLRSGDDEDDQHMAMSVLKFERNQGTTTTTSEMSRVSDIL